MTLTNNFLDLMGFDGIKDLVGTSVNTRNLTLISIAAGGFGAFIETWTGISMYFWLFLTMSTVFDVLFGMYANMVVLGHHFESRAFFRGIFKSFIVLGIIVITNSLYLGVEHSNISPNYLKEIFQHMASAIHYSFVMLISLYLLTGISENGAKIDIPVFKSLSKLLKIKINKIEHLGDEN